MGVPSFDVVPPPGLEPEGDGVPMNSDVAETGNQNMNVSTPAPEDKTTIDDDLTIQQGVDELLETLPPIQD